MAEAQRKMTEMGIKLKSERVFCILDIRDSQVSLVDGITNLKEFMFSQRKLAPEVDVQVQLIFVGVNTIVKNFMQVLKMAPKGRYQVSTVSTMDEALALVAREMPT